MIRNLSSHLFASSIVAAVALMFGFVGSLFATEASLFEKFILATMPAGIAFVAAMMLFLRDQFRHDRAIRSVQKNLLNRTDISTQEFLSHFPQHVESVVVSIRIAIAKFFDVQQEKIHPEDDFTSVYQIPALSPGFQFFVTSVVFTELNVHEIPPSFHIYSHHNISELAEEVEKTFLALGRTPPVK